MDTCYEFGRCLRRQREAAGLSLRQLADLARANHSYINRLEHGQHACPSRQMVLRLARALRIRGSDALAAAGYMPEHATPEHLSLRTSRIVAPMDQDRAEAKSLWPSQERSR